MSRLTVYRRIHAVADETACGLQIYSARHGNPNRFATIPTATIIPSRAATVVPSRAAAVVPSRAAAVMAATATVSHFAE